MSRIATRAGFPDRVLSAAGRIDTRKRRLLVMAAAAHELLTAGEQVKARDVLDKAVAGTKESSPENNDAGFQATARELAHGGRLEEALQTVETLSQARDDWRAEGLREVAVGLAEAGEVEIAIKTLNSIPDIEKRAQQFQEFIRKGSSSVSRARAIDALIEMAPQVPDEHNWRSGGLSAVSRSLTDQGEVNRALGVARSIPQASFRAGALDYIANKMISLGQFGKASAAIDDALSARPDGASYIAKTLARLGRLTSQNDLTVRAERMLEAAILAAPPERQPFPDRAFGFIAADWAELGNTENVWRTWRRARRCSTISFLKGSSRQWSFWPRVGASRRRSSM
jgi:tetratricopeptide (TPR) repeat protein